MEVKVMKNILGENDRIAEENRKLFAEKKVFVLNLMGSPGSGKTSLLEKTLSALAEKISVAVVEGDLFTAKDADMVRRAVESLDLDKLDLLIVENVGNLVCPAEFDVGENLKAVVLSITEGDDKPLKYPLIFKESAVTLLNKVDLLEFTNFDLNSAREDLTTLHPNLKIIETSCTKNIGLEEWTQWLLQKIGEV